VTRTRLLAGGLLACALVAPPRAALALLEPSRAQAEVDQARREEALTFCSDPHRPLSRHALSLCGSSGDIPSCEGFTAACADARAPGRFAFSLSPATLAAVGWAVRIAAWLVVLSLVLALLVPIARVLSRSRWSRARLDPEVAPSEPARHGDAAPEALGAADEEALLKGATELARRGEHGVALQLCLAASLRALDKRGAVRMAKDRTNGEYVRSCTEAEARAGLRDIVREVDRVQFGHEEATREAADRALGRATAIVRGLGAALLVMAASTLLGCGGSAVYQRLPGDDPAGSELLLELLRRQDVRTEPLRASLASLPLPRPGERAPAVLVDAERIEMDDETSAHLVDWVDAGGTLVLAGAPEAWPDALGTTPAVPEGAGKLSARRLLGRARAAASSDDDEGADVGAATGETTPVIASGVEHGEVGRRAALRFKSPVERVAWFEDDRTDPAIDRVYAALIPRGKGWVLGIASDELLTNAGLARPGNAAALVAILSNADRLAIEIAQPEDGLAAPSTPLAAMNRAGLGPGMLHALLAALVLFLAEGVRLARPAPAPAPARRAFAEHVEATGRLYARADDAHHTLLHRLNATHHAATTKDV